MRSKNTIRLGGVSALRSPTAILTEVFVPAAAVSDVAVSAHRCRSEPVRAAGGHGIGAERRPPAGGQERRTRCSTPAIVRLAT